MSGTIGQNTKTQQRKGRPTEHLAFEEFEAVDVSLNQPIAPGKLQSCHNRRVITANSACKGAHFSDFGLQRCLSLPPNSGVNGCPLYSTKGSIWNGSTEAKIRSGFQARSAATAGNQWQERAPDRNVAGHHARLTKQVETAVSTGTHDGGSQTQ